ncbi:pyrroline-5-carboxylate reductase [Endozoicomonas sp. SM1973]|uniref:Pyrroline-5-carboxylate reductase n=1 Tax=Spartinivicinus marinus TaxID=2994442 RepID=A0A853HZI0_9GAMM|nr:pyrroline-5-carboxylate reductase [Spartinivicinus marinus]MCX4026678.1 pyrroline-5-carboxylate reductase [Spartinivicinus marinus]NYZ64512.1 pyrroline-5-carboxylate reductase [Spartinivicinus marinus]
MKADKTIAFLGAGNMARSIIGGLVQQSYPSQSIWATARSQTTLDKIPAQWQIQTTSDNKTAVQQANIVVLAVKPKQLKDVLATLAPVIVNNKPLLVSVAAGIPTSQIASWAGDNSLAVIRSMPNTPSLVGKGATGLYANKHTTQADKDFITELFATIGNSTWVEDEELLHAVTAVSGSAPAYFFLLLESMVATAKKMGLTEQDAIKLASQTAIGAGLMAQQGEYTVTELKQQIMSPGGTTEQAIQFFEQNGFKSLVNDAMEACYQRSVEMATEYK